MSEFRAFVVVAALLAMLFTAATAAVWLRQPAAPAMVYVPPPDSPIWTSHSPSEPKTAEQLAAICGRPNPELVDGALFRGACYATVEVSCPPACEYYRVAVEGAPGVRRVQ